MAIKEIVRALALFVGYELPNSSGQTGGIFDGIEDSVGGVSDGLEDVNSGLDSANDKAKKFKAYLMGFDVAQVIPDQSDSDKDGSSGTGGMTVDPKILDALNKYKYLFDDIQMKATDIRDKLLGWKDAIGSAIKENIFEPMWNSWQKYGSSITKNLSDTGSNIGHIFSGIFDVIGEKWKPFFQSASDLFFSLLDTASEVSSSVSKLLKSIWDHGGKYLFEKVADFVTSLMTLANKINDTFIKPVIKWFKQNLASEVGRAVGIVLKTVGDFIDTISKFIGWLSNDGNHTLEIFVGIWASLKIAKLVSDFKNFSKYVRPVTALTGTLTENFGFLGSALGKVLQFFDLLFSQGFSKAISLFPSLNNVWTKSTDFVNIFGKSIGNVVTAISNMVSSHFPKLGNALEKVGGWLSSASFGPWVIGIGTAITGIMLLVNWLNSFSDDYDKVNEKLGKNIKDREEDLTRLADERNSKIADTNAKYAVTSEYLKKLNELTGGKDGYVENIDLARTYIEKINEVLPDSLSISEDGYITYQKQSGELANQIDLLKQKAYIEAYEEEHIEILKQQQELNNDLADAIANRTIIQNKLNDAVENLAKTGNYDAYDADIQKYKSQLKDCDKIIGSLKTNSKQLSDKEKVLGYVIESNTGIYDRYTDAYNLQIEAGAKAVIYENSTVDAISGSVAALLNKQSALGTASQYEKDVYEDTKVAVLTSLAEQYEGTGTTLETIIKTFEEYGIEISEEQKNQIKENQKNRKNANKDEVQEFNKTKDEILKIIKASNKDFTKAQEEEYSTLLESLKKHGGKISTEYTSQYQSMLRTLKENNVDLNTEQGEAYSRMFTLLQEYGFDFNDEQTRQFAKGLELAIASGDEQGKEFIGNLKTSISKDSIEPEARSQWWKAQSVFVDPITGRVTITNTTDVANGARSELTGKLSNLPSSVQRAVGNVWSAVDYVAQYFGNSPLTVYLSDYLGNKYGAWSDFQSYMSRNPFQASVDIASGSFKWMLSIMGGRGYATGGFPSMGEMFIAREAGPEFVGTMGGRTAVANNYQIENGIYRAVKSAMQGTRNSKQTIHLTFNLPDGTKIEKVIEDYNDYINRNGGKGGFDI